jgi:hypothetical protein
MNGGMDHLVHHQFARKENSSILFPAWL